MWGFSHLERKLLILQGKVFCPRLQKIVDINCRLVYNRCMKSEREKKIMRKVKEKTLVEKLGAASGWIGMLLIHGATLPTTLGVIMGYSDKVPPVSMVVLVWSGLMLFLFRAIVNKDTLYIVSNAVGFFFNSILLALIVFK